MTEKLYDLVEKMYIEMQEMKSNMATKDDIANMATKDDIANMATKDDIQALKDDVQVMKGDIQTTKTDVQVMKGDIQTTKEDVQGIKQRLFVVENKMDVNQKVWSDGYKLLYGKMTDIEVKVDKIDETVQRQDIEIKVIKSSK